MKFIGITGGVGAGKSTILEYLQKNCNAKVMLADEIAHDLMEPGAKCYEALKELFTEEGCFFPDGSLNRKRIAEVIFKNKEKLAQMNAIVHPAVKNFIMETYEKEKEAGNFKLLILEAALLIEEHYDKICDELWYVYTSEENRTERLMKNRGYSKEKVEQIFKSQLSEEEYRKHCAAVIDNNASEEDTIANLKKVLKERIYDE